MENKKIMNLNGVYTALVTPMKSNRQIDYKALENLINFQLKANIDGIVILGTTGESPTLDYYEKHRLIEFVQNLTYGKTNLIIGAGSNDTEKTISEIQGLSCSKADAILLSCPAYNKPTSEGLYSHFKTILDHTHKPIILYNVPSRTGVNIPISVLEKLKSHENLIGIKDASGDITYATKLAQLASKDFVLLSGNDNITLPLLSLGYSGVISVLSNAFPNEMKYLIDLSMSGDKRTSLILQNYMLPLMDACFIETNPIPIKYILSKLKLIKNNLRLPLTPLSKKHQKQTNKLLEEYKFI